MPTRQEHNSAQGRFRPKDHSTGPIRHRKKDHIHQAQQSKQTRNCRATTHHFTKAFLVSSTSVLPTNAILPSNPILPCSLWSLPNATSIHLAVSPQFHSHNNSIPTAMQPAMLEMPSSATCHSLQNLKDASLRISNAKPAYSTGIHHPVGLFAFLGTVKTAHQKHSVSREKQEHNHSILLTSLLAPSTISLAPSFPLRAKSLPFRLAKTLNHGGKTEGGFRNIIQYAFFVTRSAHQELRFWCNKELM